MKQSMAHPTDNPYTAFVNQRRRRSGVVRPNGTVSCVPGRVVSRKSLLVLLSVFSSLTLFLVTSHRLGAWPGFGNPLFCKCGGGGGGGGGGNGAKAVGWTRPETDPDRPPRRKDDPLCAHFPDTRGMVLVMKTGASEAFARLPTQFLTALRCVDDFLVFGDMDQLVAGYHVRDSLDTVLEEAKANNTDFDLYRRQQACLVDQEKCNKLGNPGQEAWNLDKYKNIHMAEKAYALRPRANWYVFVDADTYVLWPNLVTWLRTLRPRDRHYMGSVVVANDHPFTHGGSGYIVSQGTMRDFVGKHPGVANTYDNKTRSECCGDLMFAMAVHDTIDLSPKQVWPTINGERPLSFPYGPSNWCHPIVTMHHMTSEEISSFWDFERQWMGDMRSSKPLMIRDIYNQFVAPKLVVKMRPQWDNECDERFYLDRHDKTQNWQQSTLDRMRPEAAYSDLEKVAHRSAEDCERACESLPGHEFFQWKYTPGVCSMAKAIKVGHPVKPEENSTSGWAVQKIDEWMKEQGECEKASWPSV